MSSMSKKEQIRLLKRVKALEAQLAGLTQLFVRLSNALQDTNTATVNLDAAIGTLARQPAIWPTLSLTRLWRRHVRPWIFGINHKAAVQIIVTAGRRYIKGKNPEGLVVRGSKSTHLR